MIKKKISDEELDYLYSKPLDLYKWKCAVPSCQRFTKVWRVAGKNTGWYAWLRVHAMNWIDNAVHFWLCSKHFPQFKKRILPEDGLQRPSQIIPLKENVMKRKRYSIIQKINE